MNVEEPVPAEGWPDGPLSTDEARALLEEPGVTAVWSFAHDEETRRALLGEEASPDAVVDLVLETPDEYRMFSYSRGWNGETWMNYGTEPKGTASAEMLERTLRRYDLLAGESASAEGTSPVANDEFG